MVGKWVVATNRNIILAVRTKDKIDVKEQTEERKSRIEKYLVQDMREGELLDIKEIYDWLDSQLTETCYATLFGVPFDVEWLFEFVSIIPFKQVIGRKIDIPSGHAICLGDTSWRFILAGMQTNEDLPSFETRKKPLEDLLG